MTPFFILSTPRSRATLLMRMLDATPGVRCAGESTPLLQRLRGLCDLPAAITKEHGAESWPMHRQHVGENWPASVSGMLRDWVNPPKRGTHYGVRSSFLGRHGWSAAVDAWSWIVQTWPGAKLVFLTRDQEEVERSMIYSEHLWRPAYGPCMGGCGGRAFQHRQSMEDFHAMNPASTTLLDAADLLDFDKTAAALAKVGIPLSRKAWEQELAVKSGTREELREISREKKRKAEAAKEAEHPFFRQDLTFEEAAAMVATDPEQEKLEAWKADPFGDKESLRMVEEHKPKTPRPFVEVPSLHARAIVYPWLSRAATWDELRYSLRSIDQHFTDKECPIYILGDRPPPWLKTEGRVRFLPMDYSTSRRKGLWQAFNTGLQIAEQVLWMNDDIYLLRAQGWEDFKTALTEGVLNGSEPRRMRSANIWQNGLAEAVLDLRASGVETVHRFATHTPFLFERSKSQEILRRFRLPYKGGWVTRYHAFHGTPHEPCGPYKINALPARSKRVRFLNHNDASLTDDLKRGICTEFPEPAPWEAGIPLLIHQTWKTASVPDETYPAVWRASWQEQHPAWTYKLWTDADLLQLARDHYPQFSSLLRKARGVVRGDIGRLLVLHRHGGLYADLDYLCMRPLDGILTGVSLGLPVWKDGACTNALLAGLPGHQFFLDVAEEGLRRWKERPGARPEEIAGPETCEEILRGYVATKIPPALVCPFDWREHRKRPTPEEYPEALAFTDWRHGW